jgi:hypothetical protein
MRPCQTGIASRAFAGAFAALLVAAALAPQTYAGARVYDTEDFVVELGLRMQPRLVFSKIARSGVNEERRDFMIRRARIKADGHMLQVKYGLEIRLDGTGTIEGLALAAPVAGVENAWLQFPVLSNGALDIRTGLYDQPFSRDRLTSDSKTLAVDRGLVSGRPAALGMADNSIGVDVRGKLQGGRFLYVGGIYDNITIKGPFQPDPMLVGRIDLNLGSSKDLYHDAHFGDDKWYSLGLNGSYQNAIEDSLNATPGNPGSVVGGGRNMAVGVDGMIDVPFGPGRLFAMAEFNNIQQRMPGETQKLDTRVWGSGIGYPILDQTLQPNFRFDQAVGDDGSEQNEASIGINYYKRGHNLKIQSDVVLLAGSGQSLDRFRLQAQIDF